MNTSRARSAATRLVAEWEPQSAVLLVWPHPDTDWAATLSRTEAFYTDLTAAVLRFQKVLICCRDGAHERQVRSRLRSACDPQRVGLVKVPYDDTWIRDYGPLSVRRNGAAALVKFTFNGWGGKYPSTRDNRVVFELQSRGVFGEVPLGVEDWVLEGGSVDCDGRGTILTTARCLLSARRNPGATRARVAAVLKRSLGVQRVLWLDHGAIPGDDTDGHVDILARFTDPRTIVFAKEQRRNVELTLMERQLKSFVDGNGRAYRLVPLPLPDPIRGAGGGRLPASYVNFLIVNRAVIVPVYNDSNDAIALERLRPCFPGREVISLDARALLEQGGAIHCASMQLHLGDDA